MQEYEQYITVQEAAERLIRREPEICRMLETGALPAMLRAELWSNDGTYIKFDFALLPPEGVARVFDQGGDDFTLEWKYSGGHGKAICKGARQSSIRVLWEPSLFPELMPLPMYGTRAETSVKTESQTQAAEPKPAMPKSAENVSATNPPPVATGDIAYAFDGLRKWNEQAWKDNLGSPAKWLQACITLRGQRGIREHHWNPVLIGAALVRSGHAKPNNIRARFQKKTQLKNWEEAWKTYEANNFTEE